jgi:tetratricopeptide (TPR) repeat protein
MGLFSWLSPSPEKRLQKAQKHLDSKRFADARAEVVGLEHPGAPELLQLAEAGLSKSNLDAALSWAHAGDDDRVERHIELAARFHKGGLEEEFKSVRREIRELREGRKAEKDAHQRRQEEKLLDYDASSFRKDAPVPSLPSHLNAEEAEHAMMQIALILENYPKSLQETVPNLGPDYAKALLELEEGKADQALQTLLAMDDNQALVRYERARAAFTLGDPKSAQKELQAFAQLAQGHHPMGRHHTGEFMGQLIASTGDLDGAIRALVEARKSSPKVGSFLLAQLLFATKAFQDAERILRRLIQDHPRQTAFYKLLAFVRIEAGFRIEAMRALEQALEATHCAPGSCGFQPPDPEVKRMLATLYFEDNIELERAQELMNELPPPEKPVWDDLYLRALAAKRTERSDAHKLAESLLSQTPTDHPAHERASGFLA